MLVVAEVWSRGTALDAVTRGLSTTVEAPTGRPAHRAVQQAHPRRSALSGDARLRPRPRGTQGTRTAAGATGPHLVKPWRSLTLHTRLGACTRLGLALYAHVHGRATSGACPPPSLSRRMPARGPVEEDPWSAAIAVLRRADGHAYVATLVRPSPTAESRQPRALTGSCRGERVSPPGAGRERRRVQIRAKQIVNAGRVDHDTSQVGSAGNFHVRASRASTWSAKDRITPTG